MVKPEYRTTVGMSMKSNEPTKTKSKMKKTMRLLGMTALALVGVVMAGCSNDDNIINTPQQPEDKSNIVTLTTTVGFDEGAEARGTNRALDIDFENKKAVKTFAAGETMALVYKNTSGNTVKAVSAALEAGDITSGSKSAKFTFELENPDKTQNVTYIYPAAMANADGTVNYDALSTQNGTLTTLSSTLDLATYTAAWDGTSLPTGTLDNQLAVCAITLKNSTGSSTITSGLTQVTVNDGTNTYTVTPTSSTFGTDVIYVAIRPVTAALSYTATDGTTNYTKTATSREYAACNFYNLGLRMAVSVPSFTVGVTDGVAKKVFFAPGNLQYTKSTGKWSFMTNQYSTVETHNQSVGTNYASQNVVSLFGWGTSGSAPSGQTARAPYYTTTTNSNYVSNITTTGESWGTGSEWDWGTAAASDLGSGWRTLTKDEWKYLFNTRTVNNGQGKSYTLGQTVNDVLGVVLYPDDYTGSTYSGSDWSTFEDAGCVFLPAAGYRNGYLVYDVGSLGDYWSSTAYSTSNAYYVRFNSGTVDPANSSSRYRGYSVRLVRPAE